MSNRSEAGNWTGSVIKLWILRVAVIVASASVFCAIADASSRKQVRTVHIRFLAASTILRSTFGYNRDTFLAALVQEGSPAQLVCLIDEYQNSFPPLSQDALTDTSGTDLKVLREAGCDLISENLLLRAAPGGPIAILPIRLTYRLPDEWRHPSPGQCCPAIAESGDNRCRARLKSSVGSIAVAQSKA